jgi:hypothetical protein
MEEEFNITLLENEKSLSEDLPHIHLGELEDKERECYLVKYKGLPYIKISLHYEHTIFKSVEIQKSAFFGFAEDLYIVNLEKVSVQKFPMRGYFSKLYTSPEGVLAASASDLLRFDSHGNLIWASFDLGIDGVLVEEWDGPFIRIEGEWDPPGGWRDAVINAETGEKLTSFYIGEGYYCRIIKGHSEEDYEEYINDLHYEEDIWLWDSQKGMHRPPKTELSEEELVQYDGSDILSEICKYINQEFVPSWLLARLWYLSDGAILGAIGSMDDKGEGCCDGGDFYGYLLVENAASALGVLEIRGDQHISYGSINLVKRSESMKAKHIEGFYTSLSNTLIEEPQKLAICSVTIKDPEKGRYPWKYGFDGQKFLKYSEAEVLQWYKDKGLSSLRTLIESALKSLVRHPQHHLEKGIRQAIINEISMYINKCCKFAISRHVFRYQLEKNVLYKILHLWKETWPNETKVDELMQKFYKLQEAASEETTQQIMSNWKEDWGFMKQWTEQTYMKDINHKVHRFPQAMVGLAVVRCLKEAEEELFKYTQIKNHMEENIAINSKEAMNIDFNKVDTLEEFYEEDMYFYAACAYAGGMPYSMAGFEIGDKQKYDEFWSWWLLEAIPCFMPPASGLE